MGKGSHDGCSAEDTGEYLIRSVQYGEIVVRAYVLTSTATVN